MYLHLYICVCMMWGYTYIDHQWVEIFNKKKNQRVEIYIYNCNCNIKKTYADMPGIYNISLEIMSYVNDI
jgi:hypothetical protein